jgi:hypothetical protein
MKHFTIYLSSGKTVNSGPWEEHQAEDVMAKLQDGRPGWSTLNGNDGASTSINRAHIELIELKPA